MSILNMGFTRHDIICLTCLLLSSLPGSSLVHGILQARKLEWVAISFPTSPVSPALAGRFFTTAPPGSQHLPVKSGLGPELLVPTWQLSMCPACEQVDPTTGYASLAPFFSPQSQQSGKFSSSLEWSEKGRWKGIDSLPICWRIPKNLLWTKSECEKWEQKFTLIARIVFDIQLEYIWGM